ncbi:MAG: DUF4258 domain-containing protein [Chloroflexi bacterium]|nr:DUF4258 domain-containing protein [Chloroflexota bacterium]
MSASDSLLVEIQDRVRAGDYRVTLHAADRSIQRHISVSDIEGALLSSGAEIIESYPSDPRGSSVLILGFTEKAVALHIQCTYPPAVAVVTVYQPEPGEWTNWRVRK